MLRKRLVILAVLPVALLGCSNATDDQGAEAVATSSAPVENPYGVLNIDPPAADEAILTVDGKASDGEYTSAQFRALGATEVTIFEPFAKKNQTFVGVPLSVITEALDIQRDSALLTVALNDYQWTGNVGELLDSQALVAYQVDGRDIGYDEGGPIRLIFPDGTPMATNLDACNWSLVQLVEQ